MKIKEATITICNNILTVQDKKNECTTFCYVAPLDFFKLDPAEDVMLYKCRFCERIFMDGSASIVCNKE